MLYGLAAPVRANPCDPNSDCMLVFDGTGALVASTTVAEAVEDPNAVYTVPGIAIDPAQFGNATTLIEAGSNSATGPFSDIFGVASTGGGLFLAFSSDNEVTTPFGSQGAIFLQETIAGPYDATMYLDPMLRAAGWTAQFSSTTRTCLARPARHGPRRSWRDAAPPQGRVKNFDIFSVMPAAPSGAAILFSSLPCWTALCRARLNRQPWDRASRLCACLIQVCLGEAVRAGQVSTSQVAAAQVLVGQIGFEDDAAEPCCHQAKSSDLLQIEIAPESELNSRNISLIEANQVIPVKKSIEAGFREGYNQMVVEITEALAGCPPASVGTVMLQRKDQNVIAIVICLDV